MDATMQARKPMHVDLDLSSLPDGKHYEDRYRGFLDVFGNIAKLPGEVTVTVHHAPWSWVPLLQHLNAEIRSSRPVFKHCPMVRAAIMECNVGIDRTALEVLCSFRPETADALWKCDMQWRIPPGRVREYDPEVEFIVTTNGSFHRREVLDFRERLHEYTPRKSKALLVPCAADKPYPAPMHRACLNVMPSDFYMMNATGVVGLVPQDLWNVAPFYDSGIPNQWRLYEVVKWYFAAHMHERVVVYCDFYSIPIFDAFAALGYVADGDTMTNATGDTVEFVLPIARYDDYVDLMQPDLIEQLATKLKKGAHGV